MKPTFAHRIRRKSSSREGTIFKKGHSSEPTFFGEIIHDTFFQPAIQRKCEKCEEEEKKNQRVQRKEANSATTAVSSTPVIAAVQDSGTSLPHSLQNFFGQRLKYNFSNVKIHIGAEANQSAKSIRAKAFTYRNHIVFANGTYQPQTEKGRHLLAHELVHIMQQQKDETKNISRKADEEGMILPDLYVEGVGTSQENNTAYGCEGVNVQGQTDANYTNSFSSSLSQRTAQECNNCEGNDCITASGTLASVFRANPTVTLPDVPSGLSDCETAAVRTFIRTTLRQHELQHVAAFNTYNATIRTRIRYTGCRDGLEAYIQSIHDGIEAQRRANADARSAALDPFNAAIPCPCNET